MAVIIDDNKTSEFWQIFTTIVKEIGMRKRKKHHLGLWSTEDQNIECTRRFCRDFFDKRACGLYLKLYNGYMR